MPATPSAVNQDPACRGQTASAPVQYRDVVAAARWEPLREASIYTPVDDPKVLQGVVGGTGPGPGLVNWLFGFQWGVTVARRSQLGFPA